MIMKKSLLFAVVTMVSLTFGRDAVLMRRPFAISTYHPRAHTECPTRQPVR